MLLRRSTRLLVSSRVTDHHHHGSLSCRYFFGMSSSSSHSLSLSSVNSLPGSTHASVAGNGGGSHRYFSTSETDAKGSDSTNAAAAVSNTTSSSSITPGTMGGPSTINHGTVSTGVVSAQTSTPSRRRRRTTLLKPHFDSMPKRMVQNCVHLDKQEVALKGAASPLVSPDDNEIDRSKVRSLEPEDDLEGQKTNDPTKGDEKEEKPSSLFEQQRIKEILKEYLGNDECFRDEKEFGSDGHFYPKHPSGSNRDIRDEGKVELITTASGNKRPVPSRLLTHRVVASVPIDDASAPLSGGSAATNGAPHQPQLEWIDVASHPTAALQDYRTSIATLLLDLGVHATVIESTMESVLLPQATIVDDCGCLILRCAAEDTSYDMDSIQELTNRLTILVFPGRIVTVHRTHLPFIDQIRKKWATQHAEVATPQYLLHLLVKETARSFHRALSKSIVVFDGYESSLFTPQKQRATLAREIYHIKRRASVYSRTLSLMYEAFTHMSSSMKVPSHDAYFQDVVQDIVHVRSLSDELNDNANTVLQLLFQLSSYQLNELMRVLTMFSAFFIPISFIASVYGMNFANLPLVNEERGHLYCFTLMLCIGGALSLWFRAKGFF